MTNPPDRIDEIFGPTGVLSAALPNYEVRPGQIELARGVSRAISLREPLVAEGPTGVGKTLAVLVPAIQAGKKTVYATATIALQRQIVDKDLPFLREHLDESFTFAMLKGRANYACRIKAQEFFARPFQSPEALKIAKWLRETTTGDIEELGESFSQWNEISVRQGECLGHVCPKVASCFGHLAKEAALRADVIITNYHMLLLNDKIRYNFLACDEAHELVHITRNVLGRTLRQGSLYPILNWARQRGTDRRWWTAGADKLVRRIEYALKVADAGRLRSAEYKRITEPLDLGDLRDTTIYLSRVAELAEGRDIRVSQAATSVLQQLNIMEEGARADEVLWTSRPKGKRQVDYRPLDVSHLLRSRFAGGSVALSATMRTAAGFGKVLRDFGLPEDSTTTITVDSPFPHEKLAKLVIPLNMAEPPSKGKPPGKWQTGVAVCAARLIDTLGGKTMCLFTANRDMNAVAAKLREAGYIIRTQHEANSKVELLDDLRYGRVHAILGVKSLWTGVDIQGDALSGLLISRVPFTVPKDPISEGLEAMIKARGGKVFDEVTVPETIITLRQGVGRLIRSATDTGFIVITDTRLSNKLGWAPKVLDSLPAYPRFWKL